MNVECVWNEKLRFTASADSHSVTMDAKAPLGGDAGATPKQLLLMAVCGCSSMDIVSLLKKYRQDLSDFRVDAEAEVSVEHPAIFKTIDLTFRLSGVIEPEKALEAVRLSQTKYCSVSAMVSRAVEIRYSVELNGEEIGRGIADFSI